MASRAATLVKPKVAKAKPKAVAGKVASKSSAGKSSLSNSNKKSAVVAAKSPTPKASIAKPAPAKATAVSKSPILNAKMLKPVDAKIAASKLAKPSAALPAKTKLNVAEAPIAIAGAASFESAAPKPRRRAKGEIRTRIYWAVFNQSLRRVAVFEFDQREEAEKRAAKLIKANGEHHFLQKIKAIVQ